MDKYLYTVGVCMITYNHEQFIAQAIEGVLMQETAYTVHLYIGEDCSTDRTRQICIEYKDKYPDKITLLLPDTNLGMHKNFLTTLSACNSKYIAVCEGDDYWIDSNKLQKQVDFMEKNTDFSLVYNRVNIFNETTQTFKLEEYNKSDEEKTYTIEDLAQENFIHTPSVLIRTETLDFSYLSQFESVLMDYFLWMIVAKSGKIKYIPDIMVVYRVWEGSIWELRSNKTKSITWLTMLTPLLKIFSDSKDVFDPLFLQIKNCYKSLYSQVTDNKADIEILDKFTKKLLLEIKDFQIWWFSYMIHVKSSRIYRCKYYFYLLTNGALTSFILIKKCLY